VLFLLAWVVATPVHAQADLNCSDFGTRERAQRQLESTPTDIHRLDGDNDGKACEWNSSSGWWVWPIGAIALISGRILARRRIGDHRMVPGVQGILFNYEFSEDGHADKVFDRISPLLLVAGLTALPVTTVLRDYVFPRSATPIAFYIAIGVLHGAAAYVATTRLSRRDLYVVELAPEDEGEL
jgi:hypothetical protein